MVDEETRQEAGGRTETSFLTPAQAATLLQVKESTVKAWARNGDLAGAVKLGKEWRIDQATLLEYISQKQRRPEAFGLYYAREKLSTVISILVGAEPIQCRLGLALEEASAALTTIRYPVELQDTARDLEGRLATAQRQSGGGIGQPLMALDDDEAVALARGLVSFYAMLMEYQPRR